MTDRTFGIELEVVIPEGLTRATLATKVRRATRLECRSESYGHSVPTGWKITTDASVGYENGEVVSPILSGEQGLRDAAAITTALREAGCTVNTKCGFHVHVFGGDLTVDELRKVAVNFVHSETAFDAIMPPSRRRDSNNYVMSNRTGFGGTYENGAINAAIAAFERATTKPELIQVVSAANGRRVGGSRFRKLNFQSLLRQPTIEFRQHAGTVETDKVINWVRLCLAFVERSKVSRPRPRTSTAAHVESAELGALLKWLRLEPEACKFFRERRREFCQRAINPAASEAAAAAATAAAARLEANRIENEHLTALWEADAHNRAIRAEAERVAAVESAVEAARAAERNAAERTAYFAERRRAAEAALAAVRQTA
jgi:hypothetical protein